MTEPHVHFVVSPFQNAFFHEVAEVLAAELQRGGCSASVDDADDLEPDDSSVFVLLPPHEYLTVEGVAWLLDKRRCGRTIGISAEQPSQHHFAHNAAVAGRLGATFDFSPHAVEAYRIRGVDARHLQFGYTPLWDRYQDGRPNPGPPEVLFLGSASERRMRLIARAGWALARHDSRLVISDNAAPNHAGSASFVSGDDKRALLASARLLLNLHTSADPYFEWLRLSEAMHAGCVVLSETSIATDPFIAGTHFLTASPDSIAAVLDAVVDDEERLAGVRWHAYQQLRAHPLDRTLAPLVDTAQLLLQAPPATAVPPRIRRQPYPHPGKVHVPLDTTSDVSVVRQSLREVRLELHTLRRQIARLEEAQRDPDSATLPNVIHVTSTPAVDRARPKVSVIMALYNHAGYVGAALDSVAACHVDGGYEMVIVDDGSTDASRATVRRWLEAHPWVAGRLVAHRVNRGLPYARNTALELARGEHVFVLDADNEVYPRSLATLAEALDRDPEAWFAYGMLESFGTDGPVGLVDMYPWQPWRLVNSNYIDAMAMVQIDRLRQLGGYTTDTRLYGWEDYDLWCRVAQVGGYGRLVPNIVARYRTSATSMVALSNVSHVPAFTALREHAPDLMAGALDEREVAPLPPLAPAGVAP